MFQFGTQQRSGGKFRQACELVRNGRIGQLKTILVGVTGKLDLPQAARGASPQGIGLRVVARPGTLAAYCYQRCRPWTQGQGWGGYHLVLHLRLLPGHDRQLGDAPPRHRPMGKRHRTQRADGNRGHGVFPKDMLTNCATSWQVENRYANGVTLVHMDNGTAPSIPCRREATVTA